MTLDFQSLDDIPKYFDLDTKFVNKTKHLIIKNKLINACNNFIGTYLKS